MWWACVALLPGVATAFVQPPISGLSPGQTAAALIKRPSAGALVPLQSFRMPFDDFDPFGRNVFRLRPGTWVRVKDLGVPGVILSAQEDGSYLLQVAGRPTPLVRVTRHWGKYVVHGADSAYA